MFSLNLECKPVRVGALFGGRVEDIVLPPTVQRREADTARAALTGRLLAMRLLTPDNTNQIDITDAARLVLILHVLNPWMQQELYRAHIGRVTDLEALLRARPELQAWGSATNTEGMLEPEFWTSWADFVQLLDWNIDYDAERVVLKRDHVSLAARQTRVDRDTGDFVRFVLALEDFLLQDFRAVVPCATIPHIRRNALLLYVIARCLQPKNGQAVLSRPRFDWLDTRGRELVWRWMQREQNMRLDEVRRDDADYELRVRPAQQSLLNLLSMTVVDLPTRQLICPAPSACAPLADLRFPPSAGGTSAGPGGMTFVAPGPASEASAPLADLRFPPSAGGTSAGPGGMTFATPSSAAASEAPSPPEQGEEEEEEPPEARTDIDEEEAAELEPEEEEEAAEEGVGDKGPGQGVSARIGTGVHRCAYHDHATKRTDGFCAKACVHQRLGRPICAKPARVGAARSDGASAQKIAGAIVVGALTNERPRTRAALLRAYQLPATAVGNQPTTAAAWSDISCAVERVGASAQLPDDVDALARRGGWASAPASERLSRYVVAYATGRQRDAVWRMRGWQMTPAIGKRLDEWMRARPLAPVRTVQAIAYVMH